MEFCMSRSCVLAAAAQLARASIQKLADCISKYFMPTPLIFISLYSCCNNFVKKRSWWNAFISYLKLGSFVVIFASLMPSGNHGFPLLRTAFSLPFSLAFLSCSSPDPVHWAFLPSLLSWLVLVEYALPLKSEHPLVKTIVEHAKIFREENWSALPDVQSFDLLLAMV
ncbi:hypothetical protein EJ110_NYTH12039 [Nymphaea thermarum]|nr:hypothetical protein EJ110_NYTH12039 [Nymphaea thermarum]